MSVFDKRRAMPAASLPVDEIERRASAGKPTNAVQPGYRAVAAAHAKAADRELWLAIHLPGFMLDAFDGAVDALKGCGPEPAFAGDGSVGETQDRVSSRAILDLECGGRIVCACDEAAAAAGVVPGMAINSALALLPGLQTRARDTHRECRLLEAVAEWGLGFTPRVSLDPPDTVLLEVRTSLRLFGGVRELWRELRTRLQDAGLKTRLALTPTPLASIWFARSGEQAAFGRRTELPGRLASLPVECTRWPAHSLQLLATMGVRSLGDCLRLPRDGFTRRFTPQMLRMLDQAVGRLPDPRPLYIARRQFVADCDLEPEISDVARLEVAVAPLLDELCVFLQKNCSAVQAFELHLVHPQAGRTVVDLCFVQPTAGREHIGSLLHERLSGLVLCEAVRSLSLHSRVLTAAEEVVLDLFAGHRRESRHGVTQLIERLRARLGPEAVHGLSVVPEHRPEFACAVMEPMTAWNGSGTCLPARSVAPVVARPLWLLAEPQPMRGGERPCHEGELHLEAGPERIETGWWDGHDVARDYYVARNPAGVRLWVFRERRTHKGWFLHGVFA
jgi:protein ImuB